MSTVSSIFGTGSSTASSGGQLSGSNSQMTATDFYKLIAAQLANQDPDNPTDPNQMVQSQMSIANYQAIQTQTTAMSALSNNTTASNLLGKEVTLAVPATTSTAAQTITGTVSAANFYSNGVTLTVNGQEYEMGYVTKITPAAADATSN